METLGIDKGSIRGRLPWATELVSFYFLAYEQIIWPINSKKASQANHDRNEIMQFFEQLRKYFTSKQGAIYSKPDTIKRQITDLYNLLSDEDKADIRQELAKEQIQLCRTNPSL